MFSDHMPKIEEMPYKKLLLIAAGLVILCQLAAMAFVAESQVAKAKERDSQRRTELMAISQCMETSAGAARSQCVQQARVVLPVGEDNVPGPNQCGDRARVRGKSRTEDQGGFGPLEGR